MQGTSLLAQSTSHTCFRIVQTCYSFSFDFAHTNGLEWTNGCADFTAYAVFFPKIGFGPLRSFNPRRFVSLRIPNGAIRAASSTNSALNAFTNIDLVRLFFLAAGGSRGTCSGTCLATFALLGNNAVSHFAISPRILILGLKPRLAGYS
jgi:hypothetical protein